MQENLPPARAFALSRVLRHTDEGVALGLITDGGDEAVIHLIDLGQEGGGINTDDIGGIEADLHFDTCRSIDRSH